ncbi:MAG: hypothetical protein JW939_04270 [Candidatus Thermoplasmatota archaeon]|nr:hypothetical protein [Candidatus Thermoplasmatota archaeon]
MDERTRAITIGAVALLFLTAVVVGVISFSMNGKEGDGNDGGEPEIKLTEMNVTVIDVFTTDRVTGLVTPVLFTQNFLVLDLKFENPLDENITFKPFEVELVTDRETHGTNLMDEFVGRAFGAKVNMTPFSSISGYLYYAIFPVENVYRIQYLDTAFNITFSRNLSGFDQEHRPWITPLEFRITGCGRDENGSGKERFLHFFLEVTNPTQNSSHFQMWLLDLDCWNGVKLDGLFIPQPEGDYKFLPGWNVTYKVYFDIPRGSPDRPKVLYQDVEDVYLDVDEQLYQGLI